MLPGEAVAGAPVGIGRDVDVVLGGRAVADADAHRVALLSHRAAHPANAVKLNGLHGEADAVVSLGRDVLLEISG